MSPPNEDPRMGACRQRAREDAGAAAVLRAGDELLRETEERYRRLFETAQDGIAILNGETGEIDDLNPFLLDLLGYQREELLHKRLWEIGPFSDVAASKAAFLELQANGYVRYDHLPLKTRAGSRIDVEFVSNVYRVGRRRVIQCNIRDISERRRLEAANEKFQQQIRNTQKLESLGVLAGGVAHDFNNLLTVILGHAELAGEEAAEGSAQSENIQAVARAGRRAADLCSQLLAYSGRGRFVVRPLDLNMVIRDTTSLLAISASKKAVLKLAPADDLPLVMADAVQMQQLLMNLVMNASEAIGDNPGVVEVRTGVMSCDHRALLEMMRGESLAEGRYAFFEVSDTGCGMSAETRSRMFDPFFTTKLAGRGLGLAATLGIVRGHRGAIQVTSEQGRGSTLRVLLPVLDGSREASPAEKRTTTGWRGHGTLLLVDDDDAVRTVAADMLRSLGFEVLPAEDGGRALRLFERHASDIVGVVLDLTMPGMSGEETYQQLKKIRKDVRVLLFSGYSEHELALQFADRGFVGFMHKPFDRQTLMAHLQNLVAAAAE